MASPNAFVWNPPPPPPASRQRLGYIVSYFGKGASSPPLPRTSPARNCKYFGNPSITGGKFLEQFVRDPPPLGGIHAFFSGKPPSLHCFVLESPHLNLSVSVARGGGVEGGGLRFRMHAGLQWMGRENGFLCCSGFSDHCVPPFAIYGCSPSCL